MITLESRMNPSSAGVPVFMPPLVRFVLMSPFGMRMSPTLHVEKLHEGLDLSAPVGTPIYSAAAGTVLAVGFDASEGNYVAIDHGSGWGTRYLHMNTVAVPVGRGVLAGGLIGTVGKTGLVTGPHLHFEVHHDGVTVNPQPLVAWRGATLSGLSSVGAPLTIHHIVTVSLSDATAAEVTALREDIEAAGRSTSEGLSAVGSAFKVIGGVLLVGGVVWMLS